MAITMNGQTFRTLDDELYLNGKRVIGAYADGTLAYPDNTPAVIKFASAHTCDTFARWDNDTVHYNRYCSAFSGKMLVSVLFPSYATSEKKPLIGINQEEPSATYRHAKYAPMSWMTYSSTDFTRFKGGVHGDDFKTCLSTHSEIALQFSAELNETYVSQQYRYRLYQNSIEAITDKLSGGLTLHFDYHEGIIEIPQVYTKSDIIVVDPREITLGSSIETYSGRTYVSTYGIRIAVGLTTLTGGGGDPYYSREESRKYWAPRFTVMAVLGRTGETVTVPIGMFFVDTVIYPNIAYVRRSSRFSDSLVLSYRVSAGYQYTDVYNVYEFTQWPTATDADLHATIAELGSLT